MPISVTGVQARAVSTLLLRMSLLGASVPEGHARSAVAADWALFGGRIAYPIASPGAPMQRTDAYYGMLAETIVWPGG
ncbi:MAG TPA: hypothetical protein PK954_18610, partial [Anaerolineales bacterium]|nr:hypothetical protein [Anaerolineales bacterium]